mmetsp:Transcript_38260/g.110393  ORF Transcript_38260/g.110393 Transcript_38260/m.110393 type:complete len:411 (+) Transcript_38260:813-2045(+)
MTPGEVDPELAVRDALDRPGRGAMEEPVLVSRVLDLAQHVPDIFVLDGRCAHLRHQRSHRFAGRRPVQGLGPEAGVRRGGDLPAAGLRQGDAATDGSASLGVLRPSADVLDAEDLHHLHAERQSHAFPVLRPLADERMIHKLLHCDHGILAELLLGHEPHGLVAGARRLSAQHLSNVPVGRQACAKTSNGEPQRLRPRFGLGVRHGRQAQALASPPAHTRPLLVGEMNPDLAVHDSHLVHMLQTERSTIVGPLAEAIHQLVFADAEVPPLPKQGLQPRAQGAMGQGSRTPAAIPLEEPTDLRLFRRGMLWLVERLLLLDPLAGLELQSPGRTVELGHGGGLGLAGAGGICAEAVGAEAFPDGEGGAGAVGESSPAARLSDFRRLVVGVRQRPLLTARIGRFLGQEWTPGC